MTIFTKVMSALCCLAVLLLCAALWKVDNLQGKNTALVAERDKARVIADSWKKTASFCARSTALLQDTTRACLEREQEAAATAEHWQEILANAQSRDTTEREKQGVPDNATRRKLFTDLDRPL